MRSFAILATIYAATVGTTSGKDEGLTTNEERTVAVCEGLHRLMAATATCKHVDPFSNTQADHWTDFRDAMFVVGDQIGQVGDDALVDVGDRTWVDVDANGYDTRTNSSGCSPKGCVPENTRDGSRRAKSRWSCQGEILDSSDEDDGCCITYYFEEPQDIQKMQIAFHQGNKRTRTLDVYDNHSHHSTITSGGKTSGFETFNLYTDETEEIKLCLNDPKWNTDVWLSITEVKFLVK